MNYLYFVSIILIVSIIGVLKLVYDKKKLNDKKLVISEFLKKFNDLIKDYNENRDTKIPYKVQLYVDLMTKVDKIVELIGNFGVIQYSNRGYHNDYYNILLNTIPKVRSKSIDEFHVLQSQDALIRSIGYFDNQINDLKMYLVNPFRWMTSGFRFLLSLIPWTLAEIGLIKEPSFDKIVNSGIMNILTAIVSLLSILGIIVGILADFDAAIIYVKKILDMK